MPKVHRRVGSLRRFEKPHRQARRFASSPVAVLLLSLPSLPLREEREREREAVRRVAPGCRPEQPDGFLLALAISGPCALGRGVRRSRRRSPIARLPRGRAAGRLSDSHDLLLALAISGPCAFAGGRWSGSVVPVLTDRRLRRRRRSVMILPQVHLRKPCYDFYFL